MRTRPVGRLSGWVAATAIRLNQPRFSCKWNLRLAVVQAFSGDWRGGEALPEQFFYWAPVGL
jgi:hypothetical protein